MFMHSKMQKAVMFSFQARCHGGYALCCAEQHKVRLQTKDLLLAGAAWQHWIRRDADALRQLSAQENFERLPKMQNALLRCAEEIPDADGLTRTERQILQLLNNGSLTFDEIFNGLKKFEPLPFLGDTACRRILNDLQRRNIVDCCNDHYIQLKHN